MTKKNKKKKKQLKKINNNEQTINNKLNLKKILIIFLISRLLLIVFLIINRDLSIFELYDSIHYINMAKSGYTEPSLYAFFPLFPMLIKLVSFIIPSYQISGALISNIASFLSLILINDLTKDKNNIGNVICFVFSPILAFTSIVYTESLFLLLTILGYYLYKKDKYLLSSVVVGLSILTRNSGIILWGAIGLDMLYRLFIKKENNIKFKNIIIFGIISLLIGMLYPIYLYKETRDFLKFITVQNDYWNRETGIFINGIIKDIIVLTRKTGPINLMVFLQNWLSFFLTFILGIKILKKDTVAGIYTIVSLIAFQTSYRDIDFWVTLSSISLFRYVFNLFPIYLYLFDNKKESTNKVLYFTFILLSVFNTTLVYLGAFIA